MLSWQKLEFLMKIKLAVTKKKLSLLRLSKHQQLYKSLKLLSDGRQI